MIYLFLSSQARMAQGAMRKYLNKSYPERDECNYICLDMGVSPINAIAEECQMLPLGYDKKAVVAENCYFLEKSPGKRRTAKGDGTDKLLEYLQNPDPAIDLYLLCYSEEPDEKSKLFMAIQRNGEIHNVNTFNESQWLEWIAKRFNAAGGGIDADAVREIYNRVGGDYACLLSETDKLISYANGERMKLATVCEMVSPKLEDDAFRMSNALMRGDNESALRIYRDLKLHSIDEIRLINMLANQFLFLDQVRFLDAKGYTSNQIAGELGCKQGRVSIAAQNLRRLNEASLLRVMEELYQCNYQILSGSADAELSFTLFLANYSLR